MTSTPARARRSLRFIAAFGLALLPALPAAAQDSGQPVLDAIAGALPAGITLHYAASGIDPASRAIVVGGVRIAPGPPRPGDGALTARRVTIQGARLHPAGRGAFPIVDSMRLDGVVYRQKDDDSAAVFGTVTLTDVALPPGLIAHLVGDRPPPSEDAEVATGGENRGGPGIVELIAGLRIGGMTIENLSTLEKRGDNLRRTARLQRLQVGTIEAGRLSRLRLDGLHVDDLGVLLVDSIALEGLDLQALARLAAAARERHLPDDEAFTLDPGLDSLRVTGLRVLDTQGAELGTLDAMSLDEIGRAGDSITQGRLHVEHLRLPGASLELPEAERALQAMGYPGVDLSFEVRMARDEQARTLAIEPLSLRLADMAVVRLEVLFGAFDLDELLAQIRQMAESGVPVIPLVTLERLALTVEDQSITGRLLGHLARDTGQSEEELIAGAAAAIQEAGADAGLPEGLSQQASEAVGDFLRRPAVLTANASPATPVPVVEAILGVMTASDETVSRLGLRIEAQ